MGLASLGRRGGDFGEGSSDRGEGSTLVYSDPKLFDTFEIRDLGDPKLEGCLKTVRGYQRGDLICVQWRRLVEKTDTRFKAHEHLIIALFRWDGYGWVFVGPRLERESDQAT